MDCYLSGVSFIGFTSRRLAASSSKVAFGVPSELSCLVTGWLSLNTGLPSSTECGAKTFSLPELTGSVKSISVRN